jgi:hypothetical protein|uniref:Tail length phage protein n=1 Tax=uncultured marine virus TaxID=186617 RepID=A0A0F7L7B6_9VIRU|nr:tail length phage protein [uncultured marine virus]
MATRTIEYIIKLRDDASAELGEVSESADDAADSTKKAGKSADDMGKLMVAAAVAAAAAFAKLVKDLTDYKNAVNDMATRTGLAAETLQGLDLAARGSGLTFEQLAAGLVPFSKRVADAARGTGEAIVAFDRLGIAASRTDGSMRDLDEVFRESLKQLSEISDKGEQAALATQLFGRSGTMLLQALGDTSNLEEFEKLAKALGPDLVNASQGAADLQRALAELETAALGAGDKLLSVFGGEGGVAEALTLVTDGVVFAGEFLSTHLENVKQAWAGIFEGMIRVYDAFVQRIGEISLMDLLLGKKTTTDIAAGFAEDLIRVLDEVDRIVAARQADATQAGLDAVAAARSARAGLADASGGGFGGGGAPPSGAGGVAFDSGPGLDALDAMLAELAGINEVLSNGEAIDIEALGAAMEARAASLAMDQMLASLKKTLLGTAQIMGSVIAGDLEGVMNNAGWIGAIINGIRKIGQEGAEGVAAKLKSFSNDFRAGIRALPGIIGEVLPAFIKDTIQSGPALIAEILPALMESFGALIGEIVVQATVGVVASVIRALPDLIGGFIQGIPLFVGELVSAIITEIPAIIADIAVLFADPDFWSDLGAEFARGFMQALVEAKGEIDKSLGSVGRSTSKGAGTVSTGMLAGMYRSISAKSAGAMGNNITINGVVASNLREFSRQLSNVIGGNGLNLNLGGR